jgi:adenylate cyclase
MPDRCYVFEKWVLDCGRGTLTAPTGDVALRLKSFEVLQFLIENVGRLVSRDDLINAVWPDVTVGEESLTQCVSEVRNALDDPAQRIIKTVPKRGYLFAIPVDSDKHGEAIATATPDQVSGLLNDPSIAVLPFANLSGDTSQEYLSDGITEDIINGLSHFANLSVIARSSSFSYKGRATDVRDIGRQLGVRYVVEGSVRRVGDRIRITTQLVNAQSGTQRWAERFDRELGDIFAIQDEITQSIVRIVVAHLGNAELQRVSRKLPSSWTAYDLLMQGTQALRIYEQSWAPDHLYEARRHFAAAQTSDPRDARICAMLGHTYARAQADPAIPELGDPDVLKQGYELASGAVALDPNLPLARALLGWTLQWMHEPDAAVREYDKAQALNSNFWDWRFPNVLVYAGAASRALDVIESHVRLDPFHPPHVHAFQGHALYMLKRYDEAVAPFRESFRRGPQVLLAHVWLAATLIRLGQRAEAREIIAEVLRRAPRMAKRWRAPSLYRNSRDSEDMIEALREAGFSSPRDG